MWLGANAPESAKHFYPLAVISHGAIGASVLVSKLPDTLSLDYRVEVRGNYLEKRVFGYPRIPTNSQYVNL